MLIDIRIIQRVRASIDNPVDGDSSLSADVLQSYWNSEHPK